MIASKPKNSSSNNEYQLFLEFRHLFSQGARATPCSGTANASHMRLFISPCKNSTLCCFENHRVLPHGTWMKYILFGLRPPKRRCPCPSSEELNFCVLWTPTKPWLLWEEERQRRNRWIRKPLSQTKHSRKIVAFARKGAIHIKGKVKNNSPCPKAALRRAPLVGLEAGE